MMTLLGLPRVAQPSDLISVGCSCGSRHTAVICVARRHKQFNGRDRVMLELMEPHYEQACGRLRGPATSRRRRRASLAVYGLTPRETEVANWLAVGKANPEIAAILCANVRTVEKHVERILEKLGVENRTAAALVAARARS